MQLHLAYLFPFFFFLPSSLFLVCFVTDSEHSLNCCCLGFNSRGVLVKQVFLRQNFPLGSNSCPEDCHLKRCPSIIVIKLRIWRKYVLKNVDVWQQSKLWQYLQIPVIITTNFIKIWAESVWYLRQISFIFAPNLFYICTKYLLYLHKISFIFILRQIPVIFPTNLFFKLRQICLIFASNLYHICTKSLFIFATNPFDICELFSIAKQRRWRQKWADCISSATQPILEATIRGKEI